MDKVAGSARMKLRFTLEARRPGKAWRRVAAPELGGWRTADAATTRFISTRRVTQLVGPSYYRTLVRFRWVDADGEIVAATRARSRACWQPDHRPNLKLLGLSVEARQPLRRADRQHRPQPRPAPSTFRSPASRRS